MKLTGPTQVFVSVLKQVLILAAMILLLAGVLSLVWFGFDWWNYCHSPKVASISLDYRGLSAALFCVVVGGVFVGAALLLAYLDCTRR